ncbi:peptidyl-prolyl cis-trans isomerase A (cyclophilin A) [Tibeticola sediminis]|uniref:Peptidyl-prolyl cis-trans isomerase n=1 Tax=Tibeticola sediminis TaxID=1917811 RepID=A0A3N4V6D2_9BURK|nr:peptidylprolyl isomerase [Tibeticola sediminis]RPE72667.1 peptidyl-prolyl cis-trans isomerase A (cyclophilin A) [Tibeticola sediminis]
MKPFSQLDTPHFGRRALLLAAASLATLGAAAARAATPAPRVRFSTNLGAFTVELDPAKAPVTVENFIAYVRAGHYDGTVFHRVIDGFMIQGGGYDAQYAQRPTRPPIQLEANNGLKNQRGTIAMARTANPNSATAQFFINVVDNPNLDAPRPDGYGYAVFGRVVEGMDVIDRIRSVPTGPGGPFGRDVPRTPVVIQSATLLN